jgi:oligopeptide transport system ATP-binding protein
LANNDDILLDVRHLKQYFKLKGGAIVKAVDDVSFQIYRGETFGLVGESGSGKSTTGRSIIKLYDPTGGEVIYKGQRITVGEETIQEWKRELAQLKKENASDASRIEELENNLKTADDDNKVKPDLRQSMQMIFQDPMASLNPRMRVIDIIAEGLDVHHLYQSKEERKEKVMRLLKLVGLSEDHAGRYPHEFSGGQRQRIGIARALITNPDFIIADEPISALDVSIQAQVVNLMNDLKNEFGLTYLFIAHDLSMVHYISDRIGVMHLGRMVELGSADDVNYHPIHPYTKSLLSAIPMPDPDYERNRQRVHYEKQAVDYEAGTWTEVNPGHFVLGTLEEIKEWTNNEL